MNRMYTKKWSMLVLVLFLLGAFNTVGQNISSDPTVHKVVVDQPLKPLYEHEYNSGGQDATREGVDTVMVTSVMNYFVMPDAYYNKGYFNQPNYQKTDLTSSKFEWTVTNGTTAPQSSNGTFNSTGTSPWVKVTWGNAPGALGATTVKMKEVPQGLSSTCEGEETSIPIYVINKPQIEYSSSTASDCYADADKANAEHDFQVAVTTESSQVWVNCSIKWTKLDGTNGGTTTETNVPVKAGEFNLKFTDYGEYEVTITKVTDRIARKCDVLGDITNGKNVFTYSVLSKPKAGKVYHVPNNY